MRAAAAAARTPAACIPYARHSTRAVHIAMEHLLLTILQHDLPAGLGMHDVAAEPSAGKFRCAEPAWRLKSLLKYYLIV